MTDIRETLEKSRVTAILSSKTEDEVWDADKDNIEARNLPDTEITVHRIRESLDDVLLDVECTAVAVPEAVSQATGLNPGSDFIMSTGAAAIVDKLRWLGANDMLPVTGVVKCISSRGRTILRFIRSPSRD